jgi:hypothetical protein
MKKLITTVLLITLFGCGPSLKEKQATFDACANKHYQEMSTVYKANPQQLFIDLCKFNKLEGGKCFEFIVIASQYGRLQEEVSKFAFARAEEICGKYPTK